MMKQREIKFIANVVKWFDKINGDTYHSVQITRVEDGKTLYCPSTYGHGNHYQQTALKKMAGAKWLPVEYHLNDGDGYERENNYPIAWIVTNGLKRDCIANGMEGEIISCPYCKGNLKIVDGKKIGTYDITCADCGCVWIDEEEVLDTEEI